MDIELTFADSLRAEPLRPVKDANGYLTAQANVTRAGVFVYKDVDGREIRMLRPELEVFSPDSVATILRKPATNRHPDVETVDARTIKPFIVGGTGDKAEREGTFLRVPITVWDGSTVAEIEDGNLAVSAQYKCKIRKAPGVHPQDGPYDAEQYDIRYNSVAVAVEKARGGEDVRLLMDSVDKIINPLQGDRDMAKKIKIGDSSFDVPEDLADAFGKMMDGAKVKDEETRVLLDSYKTQLKDATDKIAAFEKKAGEEKDKAAKDAEKKDCDLKAKDSEIERLKGSVDELTRHEKELKDSAGNPKKMTEALKSKLLTVARARVTLKDKGVMELMDMDEAALIKAAVQAADPQADLKDASADYLRGRFEQLGREVNPEINTLLGELMLGDSAGKGGAKRKEPQKWEKPKLSSHQD